MALTLRATKGVVLTHDQVDTNFDEAYNFLASGTGAVSRTVRMKLRDVVSVKDFRAVGDGVTDDTVALQAAADSISVGTGIFFPPGTYIHGGYLTLTNKSNFAVLGHNAILKTKNGQAVTAGNGGIKLTGCTDGYIRGLRIDENRGNRTPSGAADSMGVHIGQDCARLTFRDIEVKDAVSDAWYIYKNVGVVPTDVLVDNCSGLNSFRNNMTITGATRLTVRGGNYSSATGLAPQSGIDIEPDTGTTNTDIVLEDLICSTNVGYGVQLGGSGTNTRVTMTGVQGRTNTLGLLNASGVNDLVIRDLRGDTYSSSPTRSVVDFGSGVVGLDVDGIWLKDLTFSSTTLGAVYLHASITGRVTLRNIGIENYACRGLDVNSPDTVISAIHLKDATNASNYGLVMSGARSKATDVGMRNMTGLGVYISASHNTVADAKLHDVAGTSQVIKVDTGGDYFTLDNIEVTSTGAKANTNALNVTAGVLCKEIIGFTAKDNASGWTSANIFSMNRASMAGAGIEGVSPDFLATTATWNIGNLAALGFEATTVTFAPAALGDYVDASLDATLDDGVVTGFVILKAHVPADGFVRVGAFNIGTVAFNPASATLALRLRKR